MPRTLDYGSLMQRALHRLIRDVLADVQRNGLPAPHHFFVTFGTAHPGVAIAGHLKERYPDEMTIVMQNWFDDLDVSDDGFSVTLNFGDEPETIRIPFAAIRAFVDPSVEFGLSFQPPAEEGEGESPPEELPAKEAEPEAPPRADAEVVSLDSFRK